MVMLEKTVDRVVLEHELRYGIIHRVKLYVYHHILRRI